MIERATKLLDAQVTAVHPQQSPIRRRRQLALGELFAHTLLVHPVNQVITLLIKRIVRLALDEGQHAVEAAKHAVRNVEVIGKRTNVHP